MERTTAGLILAGGQSRRMGRDKACLPLPGTEQVTFLQHLAQLLLALCTEVVIVVRDSTQFSEMRVHDLPAVRMIADDIPNYGPLMGLYSGLRSITSSHALVTAVDMPALQPAVASWLLTPPLTEAIRVPVVDDIPQVLLSVYPRSVLPLIAACLRAGRRDPRCLLHVAQVEYIAEAQLRAIDPALRSFVNVNTAEDLSVLRDAL